MDHTAEDPPLARYRRIAREIEDEILSGRLEAGARLPSERALAERRRISRMTARQALQHLAGRGLLETRVGRGTFVRSGTIRQELATLTGFTEEMARQGRRVASIVVEAVTRPAGEETARALDLPPGAEVHRLTRVRLVDGAPVAVETAEIGAQRAPDFFERADFSSQSAYALLRERYGVEPTSAEQTLEAAAADREVAMQLDLARGAPVLRLTRLTRDQAGAAFEYVRSVYRGEAFTMKVRLEIEGGSR